VLVEVTGDGDPITPAAVEAFATDEGALIARVSDRRTVETDESVDVHFADPESAVRERVESMGLSAAALDVDDAVRSTGVADSNVRETVKTRVTDRLDDPGAFVQPVIPHPQNTAETPSATRVTRATTTREATPTTRAATEATPSTPTAGATTEATPSTRATTSTTRTTQTGRQRRRPQTVKFPWRTTYEVRTDPAQELQAVR